MKKIFTRAAMLLAVVAMASAFTACDDGDDGGKKKFESELIGSYQPTPVTLTIPDVVEEPSPFYFLLLPTWTDPDNIPGHRLVGVDGYACRKLDYADEYDLRLDSGHGLEYR